MGAAASLPRRGRESLERRPRIPRRSRRARRPLGDRAAPGSSPAATPAPTSIPSSRPRPGSGSAPAGAASPSLARWTSSSSCPVAGEVRAPARDSSRKAATASISGRSENGPGYLHPARPRPLGRGLEGLRSLRLLPRRPRGHRQRLRGGFARIRPGGDERLKGRIPFGAPRRIPRALRERWRGGAPAGGRWFRLDLFEDPETEEPDALDEAGLDAARVRALASRYGFLCRAMLDREEEGLRWGDLFPADAPSRARRRAPLRPLLRGPRRAAVPRSRLPSGVHCRSLGARRAPAAPPVRSGSTPSTRPTAALYAAVERQALLPPRMAANRICLDGGRVAAVSTRGLRELSLGGRARGPAPGRHPRPLRAAGSRDVAARAAHRRGEDRRPDGLRLAVRRRPCEISASRSDRGRLVLW